MNSYIDAINSCILISTYKKKRKNTNLVHRLSSDNEPWKNTKNRRRDLGQTQKQWEAQAGTQNTASP
jgi:hypothetical protein